MVMAEAVALVGVSLPMAGLALSSRGNGAFVSGLIIWVLLTILIIGQ